MKYNIKTVTPFARDFIEANATSKTCAELCGMVEKNAVRDILASVRSAISNFCPHKQYCRIVSSRHGSCDDCEYFRERMKFIKEDGKLLLNDNFRI